MPLNIITPMSVGLTVLLGEPQEEWSRVFVCKQMSADKPSRRRSAVRRWNQVPLRAALKIPHTQWLSALLFLPFRTMIPKHALSLQKQKTKLGCDVFLVPTRREGGGETTGESVSFSSGLLTFLFLLLGC